MDLVLFYIRTCPEERRPPEPTHAHRNHRILLLHRNGNLCHVLVGFRGKPARDSHPLTQCLQGLLAHAVHLRLVRQAAPQGHPEARQHRREDGLSGTPAHHRVPAPSTLRSEVLHWLHHHGGHRMWVYGLPSSPTYRRISELTGPSFHRLHRRLRLPHHDPAQVHRDPAPAPNLQRGVRKEVGFFFHKPIIHHWATGQAPEARTSRNLRQVAHATFHHRFHRHTVSLLPSFLSRRPFGVALVPHCASHVLKWRIHQSWF